jgi:7-cyano-7-deazaguanine synthase
MVLRFCANAESEKVSVEKISVLASGGLDSAVLIAKLAAGAEVYPLYVRCGFAWEDTELVGLQSFLEALHNAHVMPPTVLSAPIAVLYGNHWSVTGASVPAAAEPDENTYLPGRNILLISLAAIWGSTHGVSRVAIGSLGGNPFSDATPEFFDAFARALSMGLGHNVLIEAPLRGFHKDDLIKQFKDLPLELTLTCMAPKGGKHCGRCNKCFERQDAFRKAGVADRTVYIG